MSYILLSPPQDPRGPKGARRGLSSERNRRQKRAGRQRDGVLLLLSKNMKDVRTGIMGIVKVVLQHEADRQPKGAINTRTLSLIQLVRRPGPVGQRLMGQLRGLIDRRGSWGIYWMPGQRAAAKLQDELHF